MNGRIVLVNGASSSGKTSIAEALLPLLDDPWFHVPVDAIGAMRSPGRRELDEADVAAMLRRTRLGYHRTVAALASAGNDVVMDYPLSEPWRLDDLLDVLDGYDVILVDVRCDPEELDRRERARGDRPAGLARSQAVFRHGDCDLTVDTTSATAETCARSVAEWLAGSSPPRAFDRIRSRRPISPAS